MGFKCTSSCQKTPVIDYQLKKCNVNYLIFQDSDVQLKTSSQYYTQCQIQMYVCGLTVCDLFVYSPVKNGSCCIHVVGIVSCTMSLLGQNTKSAVAHAKYWSVEKIF